MGNQKREKGNEIRKKNIETLKHSKPLYNKDEIIAYNV